MNPARPDEWVEATPPAMPLLQERVGKADALIAADQREAAFLLLWSALEGILRVLADRARLPLASLPPSALIRELYSAGEISGSQFESLMRLLPIRNRLVHGFDPEGDVDVEMVRTLVHALLAETRAA